MAKKDKERLFHGELDWLRYQLRELAKEQGVEIKNTNIMKKEECKEKIDSLNKEKYRKELEAESEIVIQEISDKDNQITNLQKEKAGLEKDLAGRNNQISELTEGIKEHEKSNAEVIESLENEIKELRGLNASSSQALKANAIKLSELEKEIEEKNGEIAELKAERTASQITMKKLEEKIKQSEERTQKSLDSKNDFIDKLQEELNQLRNRKWWQIWK